MRRRIKHLLQEQINDKVEMILDRTLLTDAELRTEIGEVRGLRKAQEVVDEAYKREP